MANPSVHVTVPATTANIGPGFDCLGAALTLHNCFRFTVLDDSPGIVEIRVTGQEADRVATDASNLAYRAFSHLFQNVRQPVPAVSIEIDLGVPLARGLGSSSTAIVAGLVGANLFAPEPFDQAGLMAMAISLEGHPDNVAPALVGGCQLTAGDDQGEWILCDIPWHPNVVPVVAIPDFELSTRAARQVLPGNYSRADAIFNSAHLGLLLRGLATGQADWLRVAMADRIHQPYRETLIPGYDQVAQAAIDSGAYGLVISGAGPTLLALAPQDMAEAVCHSMQKRWSEMGQSVVGHVLTLNTAGAEATCMF